MQIRRPIPPIINDIMNADLQLRANTPYIRRLNGINQQSHSLFFVIPPGGQSTFHVTYKQVSLRWEIFLIRVHPFLRFYSLNDRYIVHC
jgi:hypothetical protein